MIYQVSFRNLVSPRKRLPQERNEAMLLAIGDVNFDAEGLGANGTY